MPPAPGTARGRLRRQAQTLGALVLMAATTTTTPSQGCVRSRVAAALPRTTVQRAVSEVYLYNDVELLSDPAVRELLRVLEGGGSEEEEEREGEVCVDDVQRAEQLANFFCNVSYGEATFARRVTRLLRATVPVDVRLATWR